MKRAISLVLLWVSVGCGSTTVPPPDPDLPPSEPCEAGRTDDFVMGIVIFDNPRWFQAFDDGCESIEMQTGQQGGWHLEPAIQAPRSAAISDLGGRILWSATNEDGRVVANGEYELFRSFWQTLEGGDAYWGDFVFFDRNPEELVGSSLTITCELDFDATSRLEDRVLSRTVEFVDEDPDELE